MVVVNKLNEGADAGAPVDGLASHALVNRERAAVDADDKSVRIGTFLGALIEGLDNDGLLAGVLSVGQDDNLVGLEELHLLKRQRFGIKYQFAYITSNTKTLLLCTFTLIDSISDVGKR